MNANDRKVRAEAVHDLICEMLRGPHIRLLDKIASHHYLIGAGIALHNLPRYAVGDHVLSTHDLLAINDLDPQGAANVWGPWVKEFCAKTGHAAPPSPQFQL